MLRASSLLLAASSAAVLSSPAPYSCSGQPLAHGDLVPVSFTSNLLPPPPHRLCAVSPRVLLRKHPILTVAHPTGSSLWAPFCLSHLCPSQGLTPHRHRMAARYEAYLRKEVLLLTNPCFSSLFHLSIHATSSASSLDSTSASTRGIAALAKPTFRQMAVTCLFNYLGFVYPM